MDGKDVFEKGGKTKNNNAGNLMIYGKTNENLDVKDISKGLNKTKFVLDEYGNHNMVKTALQMTFSKKSMT